VLDVGPTKLRLALHVEAAADGTLTAVLDSVDQDARIPVETLQVEERAWRLTAGSIGATFTGTMNADGSAVDGTWSQGGRGLPLRLVRLAEPFALVRPQEPRPPFPYESREVAFRNEGAGIRLAGTLVVPPGDGPFPAVVLVTGSGPQDRDETLLGHKPFLVLADHLARHGIASLRYDDRGAGESAGAHMGSTMADFAADAAAALAFLAAQPKIDRDGLGIVGHSEGGLAAPRVAAAHREVDFLVLLAPPGEPLGDLVLRQGRDTLRQSGLEEDLIDRAMAIEAENLALLADESRATDALTETLRARAALRGERFSADELALLGLDDAAVEAGISLGTTPWFRSLLREDPAVHLRKVTVPVLALFADRDVQVASEVNAPLVEKALTAAGNEDFEVRVLPGLNHLFQHTDSGAVDEYGTIEETFSPQALDLVTDWIGARFGGATEGRSPTSP
jgi:pimeloyl-ACP methyl ester carboxylesterase